jgi:prevent-host-death family protein
MNTKGQAQMAMIVTASEAKLRFGSMLKQAQQEQVIIKVHGEPEAVLISYEEYQLTEALKEQNRRRKALEAFQSVRKEVAARMPDLTDEEAYKLAGVSDSIATEIIEKDREIASVKL